MLTRYQQETNLVLEEAAHFDDWFTVMDVCQRLQARQGIRSWYGKVGDRLRYWVNDGQLERARLGGTPAWSYRWIDLPEEEKE